MKSESYSSRNGTATIVTDSGIVTWTLNVGGNDYSGSVNVEGEGGEEAALYAARKAVDSFELIDVNPADYDPAMNQPEAAEEVASEQIDLVEDPKE